MGIKEKLKKEAHYMKVGAKVLPKVAGKKIKGWAKGQWEAAKERARLEKELEAEEKKAEMEAYRKARLKAARQRGYRKGYKKAREGGQGLFAQLGQVGDSISVSDVLGIETGKSRRQQDFGGAGDYIFSGMIPDKEKKKG